MRRDWIRLVTIFLLSVLVLDAVDVVQTSAHFWRTGRNPWDAWRLYGWGFAEWLARGIVLPVAMLMSTKFPLDRARRLVHLPLHLIASTASAFVGVALSAPFVLPQFAPETRSPSAPYLTELWQTTLYVASRYFLPGLALYALVAAIIHGLRYHQQYVDQLKDAAELERRALALESNLAAAQLDALKAQIHPHFIFNTLNAIAVLARGGSRAAVVRTTTRLARLLRATVDGGSPVAPLKDELRLIKSYLFIEEVRFGPRLHVVWRVDRNTLQCDVPRLSLQPLVENSVKHALAKSHATITIQISAKFRDDRLVLRVQDDGPLIGGDKIQEGVGLSNVRRRLSYLYANQHCLTVEAMPGGGVRSEITIPVDSAHLKSISSGSLLGG